jgi:UDP-glucose 6-dehydrogenase
VAERLGADIERVRIGIGSDPRIGFPKDVQALVICTEWKRFMAPNFDQLASALRHKLTFDGRNLYDPERLAELGWTY